MTETEAPRWHNIVRGVFIGIATVTLIVIYSTAYPMAPSTGPAVFWYFIGGFVCIVVHEAGHAIAAKVVRWRMIVFSVGPVAFQFLNRNLVWMRRHVVKGVAGFVVAAPFREELATPRRWGIYVAGGLLANLLLASFCVVAWLVWPVSHGLVSLHPDRLVLGLGFQSLFIASLAAIPYSRPGFSSDGHKLRQIWFRSSDWIGPQSVLWYVAFFRYKVRLADRSSWIDKRAAVQLRDTNAFTQEDMEKFLETIEIGTILDTTPVDAAQARRRLDAFKRCYGDSEWRSSCDAYLAAIWEADREAALRLWQGAGTTDLEPLRLAAEAAVAARLGDKVAAKAKLAAMDSALKHESDFRDATFRDIRRHVERIMLGPVG